jgi:hypothetical protein
MNAKKTHRDFQTALNDAIHSKQLSAYLPTAQIDRSRDNVSKNRSQRAVSNAVSVKLYATDLMRFSLTLTLNKGQQYNLYTNASQKLRAKTTFL